MNLVGTDYRSEIIFGGYDEKYFRNKSDEFRYAKLYSDQAWSLFLTNVTVGNASRGLFNKEAVLVSTFEYIGVPEDYMVDLVADMNDVGQ
eukprot:CAMPEP_0114576010 /NCGR_PEP_ID=MMETSP0125-20121206/817_1 /TAXON_ID=485358 ORGANISM="Aristerostoma sp., Strain ATCC 50986" /NCGR_SAMPLE_ID=MMETSP0125 /ASSEMBLY_ACC=CAM_ASM_000245 /LENGTH=89 /DNA_ID=CAMNT_0001764187 /DNA_START=561 /DNA_END=830 /DNA_ORIENTATION=-